MMRLLPVMLFLVTAALAGCDVLDPYPTAPHPAAPGAAPVPRVAICYNSLQTSLAEVASAAQQECSANTVATPVESDWYMQACPLLLPMRATFVCNPANKPATK